MAELQRVTVWAHALIRMHLDPDEWSFAYDRAKRRAGLTNYSKKQISLSRYLAEKWDDDDVYQTLLHETAHAMVGPGVGHGPLWKATAREIGYVGGRVHYGEPATEHAPWHGECPAGHIHYRFRRPTNIHSCGLCETGFSQHHLITWTKRHLQP